MQFAVARCAAVAALVASVWTAHAAGEMPQPSLEPARANALSTVKLADLGGEPASAEVRHLANWAVHSADHGQRPFAVIDKLDGRLFVFDADGRLRASTPALVGAARGDHTVPGIGERPIASIRPEERTTPAGRFEARAGLTPKGEDILWVDYDSALALHRVVTSKPQERRLQRLASKIAEERRITYGCINVPAEFYDAVIKPTFAAGGVVYILPELRRPQELFGSYEVSAPLTVTR
jgi:hypothetical protein